MSTPYSDILAWAREQPLWQQQALRMILQTNASIPREAIGLLTELCLAEKIQVAPLSEADLPAAATAAPGATLTGFGHAVHVNALSPGQWIPVGPKLTVIFGNNATGKSGYARLLKKAFRARVVEELQPDVRAEAAPGPASATFEFKPGAKVTWRSDAPLPADVAARFAVLDGKSGHAYLVNNELQLAPAGLDVLPRLVEALDAVRAELTARKAKLNTAKTFLDGIAPHTAAAGIAQRITAATELADILPGLKFTDADADALEAAKDALAALRSPKQAVQQLEAAARTAKALLDVLRARQALTDKKAVQEVAALREAVAAAAAAAKQVESLAADQKLVKGVGSQPWAALIEAAAAFVAEEGGEGLNTKRCPLCLEKLEDPARARLARFWDAVNGEAGDQKAEAEAALNERLDQLAALEGEQNLEAVLAALAPHAPLLGLTVNSAMASTATTAKKLRTKKPTDGVDVSGAIKDVGDVVAATAAKLQALQKGGAGAAAEAQKLSAEIQELEARKALSGRTAQLEAHVHALRVLEHLEKAQATIKTQAITHLSAGLNETYLTESYRRGVEAELKRLGFARPGPVLTQQGAKGKVRILALANPKNKAVGPEQVFSEGERTAIAIASFFSELGLTPSPVGLVFDDPIAALDQRMRGQVARRLVDEAAKRQVIVFTHDTAFVSELQKFAGEAGVAVVSSELRSTATEVGLVSPR